MKKFAVVVLLSWLVFFGGWVFVYKTEINPLAIQSEDTLPAMFLPVTILKERTFYVDTYYDMLLKRYPHPDDKSYVKGLTPFYLKKITKTDSQEPCLGPKDECETKTHYISAFPIVAGLLSVPIYAPAILLGLDINWGNLIFLSHLSSSFIVALCGGFFYLLVALVLKQKSFLEISNESYIIDNKKLRDNLALFLTGVYLFATVNFAMISQALWQHGVVQLFTILSLIFLIRFYDDFNASAKTQNFSTNYTNLIFAGLFLGIAILSRPTAAILLPYFLILAVFFTDKVFVNNIISFNLLIRGLKTALFIFLGILPTLLFFIWYNNTYFGDIKQQGYFGQMSVNWLTPFPWGFLGLWFSPSKGILIYSPVFIFSLFGAYLALKNQGYKRNFLYFVFLCIVITHTLVLGAWKHWYGGYSFGYRMASDMIPFLVLLLIPYLSSPYSFKTRYLFVLAICFSVIVQLMGLAFFDGVWHGTYDKGFWNQSWLWSIKDSEAVFNIRRLLVKLGL